MKRLPIVLVLLLFGCSGRQGVVLMQPPEAVAGRSANLALGPSAEHLWIATDFNYRSSWPSVETGYWFDDTTYYSDIQFDNQFYYDRLGGFYQYSEAVRTAVVVR